MEDFDMPGGRKFTIEEKNLSRRMIKTWARFARLGEPGWPKYTSEGSGSCNLKFLIKEFNHVDSLKLRGGTPIEGRVQLWKDEYEKILKSFMI